MTLLLAISIFVISVAMSAIFIFKDARKFAQKPPTPLIDLDRMYDRIFLGLDEESGAALTPQELRTLLETFVEFLISKKLVAEDITQQELKDEYVFSSTDFASYVKSSPIDLEVPDYALEKVAELALAYLVEINAVA